MRNNWCKLPLGNLVSLQRGHDLPSQDRKDGTIPIMGSSGLTGFHNVSKSKSPGVVIGRSGNSMGVVSFCNVDYWPLNTALYVTDFKGNDARYIYYLLSQIDFDKFNSGSAQKSLNRNAIYPYEVLTTTDKKEQKEIGRFLECFEKKIELNQQINATLEAMAQALFKSWFVDFDPVIDNALAAGNHIPEELQAKALRRDVLGDLRQPLPAEIKQLFPSRFVLHEEMGWVPEGWEVKPVTHLAKLNPEAWTNTKHPDFVRYIDLANVKGGRINEVAQYLYEDAPSRARRILKVDDTIIGTVRPGNRSFALISEKGLTGSTGFAVLRPKNLSSRSFVYLALTQKEMIDWLSHLADGAAYPAIRPDVVGNQLVVVPPTSLLSIFDKNAYDFLSSTGNIESTNATLSALRDKLLPKLLSGQIRIPEAEQQLAEVM